jgi:hypothetical protein
MKFMLDFVTVHLGAGCRRRSNSFPGASFPDVEAAGMAITPYRASLLVYVLLLLSWALAPQAHAHFPIGEKIINGNFGNGTNGWTTEGTVNVRQGDTPLNTAGGNVGFNRFFGRNEAFAVLGNASGLGIGGEPFGGRHRISQTFELPRRFQDERIATYDLRIYFRVVFDGKDSPDQPPGRPKDVFSAFLNDDQLAGADSTVFPNCGPAGNCLPDQQHEFLETPAITRRGLSPGRYTLRFELNEADGAATNTAVGVSRVSITGVAHPERRREE